MDSRKRKKWDWVEDAQAAVQRKEGLMAEHTPTPWTYETTEDRNAFAAEIGVDEVSDWRDFRHNGGCIGSSYMKDEAENEANSARLVACVNAFHSPDGREIPTDKIEVGLFWEMWDLLHWIGYEPIGSPNTDATTCLDMITDKARALLAKLEDGG